MTFRRLHALQAMLEGIRLHCPQYECVIAEDCGQRDSTGDWLQKGREPEPRPELMATEYIVADPALSEANCPNARVLMGNRNLGVAGNSNRLLRVFMDGLWDHLCLCNDDLLVTGDFVDLYARAHEELGVGLFCFCSNPAETPLAFSGPPETYKWTTYPVRGWKVKFMPRFTGSVLSITRKTLEAAGYFDASFGKFGEEHPLPGSALVWMGDYAFKPICEVKLGDEIIGWRRRNAPALRYGREKLKQRKFFHRTLCRGRVTGIQSYQSELVRVRFESGRSIICAPGHLWLKYRDYSVYKDRKYEWTKAEKGRTLVRVIEPAAPLAETDEYKKGYLRGALDGDGSSRPNETVLHVDNDDFAACFARFAREVLGSEHVVWKTKRKQKNKTRNRVSLLSGSRWHNSGITVYKSVRSWSFESADFRRGWLAGMYDAEGNGRSIGQSRKANPEKYACLEKVLHSFNFKTYSQAHQVCILGGRNELIRFWNLARPVSAYKLDKKVLTGKFKKPDKIVGVEPAGRATVYCLRTTTGNYVIEGYASKNSDFTIRCRLAGGIRLNGADMNCLDVDHDLLKHQNVPSSMSDPEERERANEEASRVMQQASLSYGNRHFYRPFRLAMPVKAGGYRGGGIPVARMLECGYELVTDLV